MKRINPFAFIFSSYSTWMILESFWRIVVIHDFRERPFYFLTLGLKQCSNIYIFLKTVFLNYLFVLLYFLLYSVFNEHLLFEEKLYFSSLESLRLSWWAQMDSNHRPRAYQARALATWAMSPCSWLRQNFKILLSQFHSPSLIPCDNSNSRFHCLVEMMGFEPMTPCLQGRCSPNWATPP